MKNRLNHWLTGILLAMAVPSIGSPIEKSKETLNKAVQLAVSIGGRAVESIPIVIPPAVVRSCPANPPAKPSLIRSHLCYLRAIEGQECVYWCTDHKELRRPIYEPTPGEPNPMLCPQVVLKIHN
jgi:hypothetical protein